MAGRRADHPQLSAIVEFAAHQFEADMGNADYWYRRAAALSELPRH
jgi:ribosomal protein S19E (S16A)